MDISVTIRDLIAESQRPKKSRVKEVGPLVNTICEHAYDSGLRNEELRSIIELLREPSSLDQTSITHLIKSLYPAQNIPSSCVALIAAALGPSEQKPSPATQNLLLWWLGVVRTALEEWNVLEKLYSILFNLLDMLTIRSNLCRILCLITRRKHVKPWRIHRLHELSQSASNDQALNALLRAYQHFYPDVIVPQGKSMELFKDMDKEWISRLNIIQEQHELSKVSVGSYEIAGTGNKRRRTEVIPRLQTRQIHENSVVLEELRDIEDFGNKYERIEYPNQIIAALDNHQLQRLMVLRDDYVLQRRLNEWLNLFFESHLQGEGGENNDRLLQEVLEQLHVFARNTKIIPKAFLTFLPKYLVRWDCRSNKSSILKTLGYLQIRPFQEYRTQFLESLEQALLGISDTANLDILALYSNILRSWIAASTGSDAHASHNPTDTIRPLLSHCSILVRQILASNPSAEAHVIIHDYTHTLAYETKLAVTYPQLLISIPSPLQIYLGLFASPSLHTVTSLSDLLCTYKDTLETYLPSQRGTKAELQFTRSTVSAFNGYVMDMCNLIWRGRAFNTTDNNAMGCLLPQDFARDLQRYVESIPVDGRYSLASLFSISFHPVLSAISIQVFRDLEDRVMEGNDDEPDVLTRRHAGPVTQRSLAQLTDEGGLDVSWGFYRTEVLDVLAGMGADGLAELIRRNIKTQG